MKRETTPSRRFAAKGITLAAGLVAISATTAFGQWPQFGGPNYDSISDSTGLADKWPDEGPRKLWHRELGDGYSTVLVDGDTLYTMYREGETENEFTVALDAKTGKTMWEHKNVSPFTELMAQFGPGPSSTPLPVGDRLFSIGTNAVLHCFDKNTGEVQWKQDLAKDLGGVLPGRGFCASPIAYKDTIIVPVGEPGPGEEAMGQALTDEMREAEAKRRSLVAFNQADGKVVWKNKGFDVTHSSPIFIEFGGQRQLVFTSRHNLVGVNPGDGTVLWQTELKFDGYYLSSPVWAGNGMLFCSSAYGGGSHGIKLTMEGGKTTAEELWYGRKIRIHHGNAICIGDYVYGSSGDFGPAFLGAVNIHTGKVVWRKRGFAKATFSYGDGKAIILDEDGQLALAKLSPDGLEVISQCVVAERYAWAAPTLVGKTLYVRDRKHIMALDLG